jgi:MFS transporter, Spinster family, sphingosine-1-phosphate transporter
MASILPQMIVFAKSHLKLLFVMISLVNLINYMDRGIIPGATNEFTNFINETTETHDPGIYIGLLQSAFIVGFAIASLIFGHLVHYHGPFHLAAIGMSVWCLAVCLSGTSYYIKNFYFLVVARMLSGVGEASIQCSIPPWISHNAPKDEAGSWLAFFYTAIPVGTAIGYAYSSLIAESIGWEWAFYIEVIIMAPFVIFMYCIAPGFPPLSHAGASDLEYSLIDSKEDVKALRPEMHGAPSVWSEFREVIRSPIFLCLVCGYAAQTGALIGVSTFGSAFLMGLGFFDVESQASTVFGAIVSVAGIIATPLGGYLVDRRSRELRQKVLSGSFVEAMHSFSEWRTYSETSEDHNEALMGFSTLLSAAEIISWSSLMGVLLLLLVYFIYDAAAYLLVVCLGCGFIFLCTPGINIAIMQAVPFQHRAFAIAITSVCIHAFGDVPSPVIAGLLKDQLAPGCKGSTEDGVGDDNVAASADCRDDASGLRLTMLILTLWLLVTCTSFSFAWILAARALKRFRNGHGYLFRESINEDLRDDEEDESLAAMVNRRLSSDSSSKHSNSPRKSFGRMDDMQFS